MFMELMTFFLCFFCGKIYRGIEGEGGRKEQ
jgi:hypothetical protein